MNSFFCETKNEVEIFERCYRNQLPLLIKGPTGCGKSHLVEFMAEKLKVPLIKVACNEDTSSADLIGRFLIKGAETVWQDGPVTRAVREGALLYLDEIAEARQDVVVALHPLTDHRRELYIDRTNEVVVAPKTFMCIASFNPGYQQSFKELKPSTRQRFVNLVMDYLDHNHEVEIIVKVTGINQGVASQLIRLAEKIRKTAEFNLKETVSTRLLVNAATLIKDGLNPRRACHVSIAEVLSDDVEVVEAIKDLVNLSI